MSTQRFPRNTSAAFRHIKAIRPHEYDACIRINPENGYLIEACSDHVVVADAWEWGRLMAKLRRLARKARGRADAEGCSRPWTLVD